MENDLLDTEHLDLEETINQLCPHESSNLPLLQILLRQRLLESTHQIAVLKHELQFTSHAESPCIENIQEGIGALLTTLSTIRSSSTEAQSVVESITKEIRTLDLAKANIENAIAGLKRLGMLVHAFDQLTRLTKARKYRETASTLQAIQTLTVNLDQLATTIPRVTALFKALQETQGLLRRTIMDEFSAAFEEKTITNNRGQLADSCLVIDALGADARLVINLASSSSWKLYPATISSSLIDWYTTFQLREYRRIFSGPSSEAGQLDNISRRYAWFRRTLKAHEDDPSGGARIFPESWKVQVNLCAQFGEATREDLKDVLARSRSTLNVEILLQALQITTTFEREMSQKFAMPYEDIAARSKSAHVGNATPIRTVFEAYLDIFVDAQDSALSDMFNQFRSSIPKLSDFVHARPDDRPSAILPSSMELFHFYRSTLDRCAALTTRKPFLDLCEIYKKWLKIYSEEILSASLSGAMAAHVNGTSGIAGHESSNPDDGLRPATTSFLLCICAILNTADYCAETADQLQIKLQHTISQELKSQVTLDSEQDLFRGNTSLAISCLLKEFEEACEPSFIGMVKLQWKEIEFVSAESAYVHELIKITTLFTDLVKQHVEQKKYVRSFCDKVVGSLVGRFTRSIVRCRPITAIASEQMILDLQVLKNHLLLLPRFDADTPVPSSYTRYLTKSVGKLDTLLKVIMSPVEPPDEFVKHYLLLVPCQSFSDFQKVLDLKGGKPQDQNRLLDVFLAMTSVQPDLADSSFLSSIDMNPEGGTTGGGGQGTSGGGVSLLQFSRLGGGGRDPTVGAAIEAGRKGGAGPGPPSSSDVGSDHRSNSLAPSSSAFTDFRRFGQKLGMGLRFSRETKPE